MQADYTDEELRAIMLARSLLGAAIAPRFRASVSCHDCVHYLRGEDQDVPRRGYVACKRSGMTATLAGMREALRQGQQAIVTAGSVRWYHFEAAPLDEDMQECASFKRRGTGTPEPAWDTEDWTDLPDADDEPEADSTEDVDVDSIADESSASDPAEDAAERRRQQDRESKRRCRAVARAQADASEQVPCPRCGSPMPSLTLNRGGQIVPRLVCSNRCSHRAPLASDGGGRGPLTEA